jgi:predicted RNA-binding Zn ribbon-like protein
MISTVTSFEPVFVANHPALDFLNTAPVEDGVAVDRLFDYAALVSWLERADLLAPIDAKKAHRLWSASPEGAATLASAIALRELLRAIVERVAEGGAPSAASLARLNAELRTETGAYFELLRTDGTFERVARVRLDAAQDILAALLRSVGALFTEVDLTLVRKCEDPTCVLFFNDTTKNHKRRWCRMETCGNRHKVSAYRARQSD